MDMSPKRVLILNITIKDGHNAGFDCGDDYSKHKNIVKACLNYNLVFRIEGIKVVGDSKWDLVSVE